MLAAFPKLIQTHFAEYLKKHRLKREIIATRLSNGVVNDMGINFISRLQDETGAEVSDIIRAYTVSNEIFEGYKTRIDIHELINIVESKTLLKMTQELNRLVRRGSRWFLRNRRTHLNIPETIEEFKKLVLEVEGSIIGLLLNSEYEIEAMAKTLIEAKVPEAFAYRIACMSAMFSSLDIVEAANTHHFPIVSMATIYFEIGKRLKLGWFRELIKNHPISNHWEALARATFRDDLDHQQRNIAIAILNMNGSNEMDMSVLVDTWLKRHASMVKRWEYFVNELKSSAEPSFTMYSVALRELLDMAALTTHKKHH